MKISSAIFEENEIRRVYDEKSETWFFSVVDIVQVLTQQPDFQTARKYWKMPQRATLQGWVPTLGSLREKVGKNGKKLNRQHAKCANHQRR